MSGFDILVLVVFTAGVHIAVYLCLWRTTWVIDQFNRFNDRIAEAYGSTPEQIQQGDAFCGTIVFKGMGIFLSLICLYTDASILVGLVSWASRMAR